jgi:hypothetical protein
LGFFGSFFIEVPLDMFSSLSQARPGRTFNCTRLRFDRDVIAGRLLALHYTSNRDYAINDWMLGLVNIVGDGSDED